MRTPVLLVAMLFLGLAIAPVAVSGVGPVVLSGHVEHTDGEPFTNVTVIFSNVDTNVTAYVMTDANGNFSLSVVDGRYNVSTSYPAYWANFTYTSISSSTSNLNFTLTPLVNQPAQLNGKVTFNGEALQGVKVVLSPAEGPDRTATTDAQGNYAFKDVTPGQYELLLSKSGYIGTSQKVTLDPLQQKSLDVTMKKDTLPGNSGFLLDYDLPHSLMILALGFALITTLAALIIRYRAGNKPEILESEEDEQ